VDGWVAGVGVPRPRGINGNKGQPHTALHHADETAWQWRNQGGSTQPCHRADETAWQWRNQGGKGGRPDENILRLTTATVSMTEFAE